MGLKAAATPTPIITESLQHELPDIDDYEWLDAPLDSITEKLRLPLASTDTTRCSWCQSPPPGIRSVTPGDYCGSTRSPTPAQGRWTPSTTATTARNSPSPENQRERMPSKSRCPTPSTPRMLVDFDAMRSKGPKSAAPRSESIAEVDAQSRPQPSFRANRYRQGAWQARRVGSPPAPPGCKAQHVSKPSVNEKNVCHRVDELFASLPPEERFSLEARGPTKAVDPWHDENNQSSLCVSELIDVMCDLVDERLEMPHMPQMLMSTQQSMVDSCRISIAEESNNTPQRGAASLERTSRVSCGTFHTGVKPKLPIDKTQNSFTTSIFDSKDFKESSCCRGCGAVGVRRVGAPPPPSSLPQTSPTSCRSPYLRRVGADPARSKIVESDDEGPFKEADCNELFLMQSFANRAILRGYGAEAEHFRRIVQKDDENAKRNGKLSKMQAHQERWRQQHEALLARQREAAAAEKSSGAKSVRLRLSRKHSTVPKSIRDSRRSIVSAIEEDSDTESSESEIEEDIKVGRKRSRSSNRVSMVTNNINTTYNGRRSMATTSTRMKNLNRLQRERRKTEYNERRRDTIKKSHADELQNFHRCFVEYDTKHEGQLKYADVMQVLHDIGIRPLNAAERAAMKKAFRAIASEKEPPVTLEDLMIDFQQLLENVFLVRKRLQELREPDMFDTFSKFDLNDRGCIKISQVDDILKELAIYPTHEEGLEKLNVVKLEADASQTGQILYREFAKVVERVREVHLKHEAAEQCRVAQELGIAEDHALFVQVRDNLNQLQEQFQLFDTDGNGILDEEEVWAMLGALGLMPKTYGEQQWMAEVMEECSNNSDSFNFPRFVKLMTTIRCQQKADTRDYLKQIFKKYDRDSNGVLDVSEISKALEDLNMCPRTSVEQRMIQEFLESVGETVDSVGSRPSTICLTFEGFCEFMQNVRERMQSFERQAETDLGATLGFSTLTLSNFRLAFSTLDSKGTGLITFAGVRQVLAILKCKVPLERLHNLFLKHTRGKESGEMNFTQLLHIVKELDVGQEKGSDKSDERTPKNSQQQEWLKRYTSM